MSGDIIQRHYENARPRHRLESPMLEDANRIVELHERARATKERLVYRHYWRTGGIHMRVMQRLGDWGRKHFPFIGRGWNGFGGTR